MISILTLFFGLLTFAQSEKVITIADQSQIFVVTSLSQPKDQPTLILLPGIYRGFYKEEEFLQRLTAKKINWVAIHFSRHPESVMAGTPVWNYPVTTAQLANEVLQVKKALKIAKPVVVSLSFSASVIPALDPNEFPWVVETAPMGRADENVPPEQSLRGWESWMSLFPGGTLWVASAEYWTYRFYWMNQVNELVSSYPQYGPRRLLISEGLAQLAYSSRRFDLRSQDFKNGPTRFWILGEKEEKVRKQFQNAAIKLYQKQRGLDANSVYVIPNSGHIVPVEQPKLYVQALSRILKSVAR